MHPKLKILEEKAKAATRGEWQVMPEEVDRDYIRIRGTLLGRRYKIANVCGLKMCGNEPYMQKETKETRANAAFIAAANPETVQQLVKVIVRLQESMDPSKGFNNRYCSKIDAEAILNSLPV